MKPVSDHKWIIYQLFPRLFGNRSQINRAFGSREENGCGTFEDVSDTAIQAIRDLGATHIWLTGIIRHASCEDHPTAGIEADPPAIVKGRAGSPYAIRDYYDVHPDLATDPLRRMEAFSELVGRIHAQGLKVIIDHVPNHVARTYSSARGDGIGRHDDMTTSFLPSNDLYYIPGNDLVLPPEAIRMGSRQAPDYPATPYAESPARATGNDCYSHAPAFSDWYETIKLNYGQPPYEADREVKENPLWSKMKDSLLFWAGKGVDGFRCDMAGMVPVAYWRWVMEKVREQYPDMLFIAEIYEPERYREYLIAGFDYLYDKVGCYDTLRGVMTGQEPATALSRVWQHGGGFDHRMLRFIENHDEQRVASSFFCGSSASGIVGMAVATLMHTGPVLLYNGQEAGERGEDMEGFSGHDGRTSIFDYWGMREHQAWMNNGLFDGGTMSKEARQTFNRYRSLLRLAREEECLRAGSFFDLQYAQQPENGYDPGTHFSFIRYTEAEALLVLINFSRRSCQCRVLIPEHAMQYLPFGPSDKIEISKVSGEDEHGTLLPGDTLMSRGVDALVGDEGFAIYRMVKASSVEGHAMGSVSDGPFVPKA